MGWVFFNSEGQCIPRPIPEHDPKVMKEQAADGVEFIHRQMEKLREDMPLKGRMAIVQDIQDCVAWTSARYYQLNLGVAQK